MRMIDNGITSGKRVLLVDRDKKIKNDRTWCFWEKEDGFFEQVVYRSWKSMVFFSNDYNKQMDIAPYTYKMIRGVDFSSIVLMQSASTLI